MNLDNWDNGGALSRFVYLHPSEFFPTAVIERTGPVSQLAYELNPDIGAHETEWVDASGRTATIDELVADDPGLDGVIVLHRGRIVYEAYPRMRPTDKHLLMSVTKAVVGTAVGILEDRGVIDLGEPIDTHIPELDGTDWSGIPVRDVLEMASGIEGSETVGEPFDDPTHKFYQMEASLRWQPLTPELPQAVHRGETYEFLMSLERIEEPGTKFVYTSMNTIMLGWLLERVTNKPLARVVHEGIWSHLGAESDALLVMNEHGIPIAHAGMATTLRDLARFGVLFTESWDVVSEERVVSERFWRRIQQGRPELFDFDPNSDIPVHPAYQWVWDNASWDDGVLWTAGYAGQYLIVNPAENLVLAQFGTNSGPGWESQRRFQQPREPSPEIGSPTARTLWRVILELYEGG